MNQISLINAQFLPIEVLHENTGQIEGLPSNPRTIEPKDFENLKKSISDNPEMLGMRELLVYQNSEGGYVVIGGNMRLKAMRELGYKDAPCKVLPADITTEQLKAILIKDNVQKGDWDTSMLLEDWDAAKLEEWGVELEEFEQKSEFSDQKLKGPEMNLKDRFLFTPFSVLDTRKGEWTQRRKSWLSIGLKSDEGREEDLCYSKTHQPPQVYRVKNLLRENLGREPEWSEVEAECKARGINLMAGTSVFDPVLCELMYRWFNVDGGTILDPFAGGSVRGVVASKCGYKYFGNDLREEQITANYANAETIGCDPMPTWLNGDSSIIDELLAARGITEEFDMVFSCPPYADLEVYSNKPEDLSNMSYEDFVRVYRTIIAKCCQRLKQDRFAAFVVGEVRDSKSGGYRNFVADTIAAFMDAGLLYYNKIILVNQIGSVGMVAGNYMDNSRKIAKIHQDVLIFYKGNPKNIKGNYLPLNLQDIIKEQMASEEADAISE